MQVGHALNMVAELPEWLEHARLPKHPAHAAAESFLMNCRMLVEFFWETRRDDIGSKHYNLAGHIAVKKPAAVREASKQVAHPSRRRLEVPLFLMTYEERDAVRRSLLDAGRSFGELCSHPDHRRLMGEYVRHAEALATWPPPRRLRRVYGANLMTTWLHTQLPRRGGLRSARG